MKITGLARCTAYDPALEKLLSNKTLGPDQGWQLLSDDEVDNFCSNEGKELEHRGRSEYDHVCAAYSAWAFDAQDASYIRCVAFLHYRIPKKMNKQLGGVDESAGTKIFKFTGMDLLRTYKRVKREENEAHIWMRKSHGEIAIDFCMSEQSTLMPNKEGRIVLPTFIPT
jgi:hypothetical protein